MELDWLQSSFTEFERDTSDAERKPLSWTAWLIYSNRYNYSNQILTLNHKLPVIYHVSPDVHFQYHIMKTAKDYTNYLNPGQTTLISHYTI